MTGPKFHEPAPSTEIREGLSETFKGRGRREPGLEWYTGHEPTVKELKAWLAKQEDDEVVRIGQEGRCRYIALKRD